MGFNVIFIINTISYIQKNIPYIVYTLYIYWSLVLFSFNKDEYCNEYMIRPMYVNITNILDWVTSPQRNRRFVVLFMPSLQFHEFPGESVVDIITTITRLLINLHPAGSREKGHWQCLCCGVSYRKYDSADDDVLLNIKETWRHWGGYL